MHFTWRRRFFGFLVTMSASCLLMSGPAKPVMAQAGADHIGPDGEFASVSLYQHGQHDGARAAVVEDHVHRGAGGPAGVEHIVDQQHVPLVDVHRQV